jgi:ABC-type amino acid transport system permease subunit
MRMNQPLKEQDSILPWKAYISVAAESFIAFYIATFCMGLYITHHLSPGSLLLNITLGLLYACIKLVVAKLSAPAMMIIIPIVPLLALIVIVTMIPILQQI